MNQLPEPSDLNRMRSGPLAPDSRIIEIDIVRGFALFGVLLVNLYNFGAESIAWNSTGDQVAFTFMRVFLQSKSWILFAMLFGFGFALQLQRDDERNFRISFVYIRRLAVLFAFGTAHALLFDGDILMLYAELGFGLLLVRRLPTRVLLVLAVGLMLIFPATRLALSPERDEIESVAEARTELERARQTDVYATGSLVEVMADNASVIPSDPFEDIDSPESGLAVFAMFLLGFSIGRSGALRDIPGHVVRIKRVRNWGLGLGLAAMAAERVLAATGGYALFRPQQAGPGAQLVGDLIFAFGTPVLALGYAAAIVLAAQTARGRTVLAPLAAVGRLALTVYLTQTLMFSTLFYGYGFGQVFRLGPVEVTAWAVIIFSAQVIACQWWSRRFRFGPMEWLWRSLTYLVWQPLRLRNDRAPLAES
ncbi:MAG: DUF418 domain-containing protein [Verrucomicrobia bacterium]|nr:DUF418 domain-containing protein [Verrucomicrobiota bacterium]